MSTDGFLLGHVIDPSTGDRTGDDVTYDPSDLTTHGVIVGMTGSGKTGLGVILLEEALLAGLPSLVIDPKGDMGNLRLLFPDFAGADELDFQQRCDRAAEEAADAEIVKVRDRLEKRLDRARDQLASAHRRMQELEMDAESRRRDEWMSGASDVLGVLLGGRRSRSLSGASRRRSQTQRSQQRLKTAEAKVHDKVDAIAELEQDLVLEVEGINDEWEDAAADIDTSEIGLEKTDISVAEVALVWVSK